MISPSSTPDPNRPPGLQLEDPADVQHFVSTVMNAYPSPSQIPAAEASGTATSGQPVTYAVYGRQQYSAEEELGGRIVLGFVGKTAMSLAFQKLQAFRANKNRPDWPSGIESMEDIENIYVSWNKQSFPMDILQVQSDFEACFKRIQRHTLIVAAYGWCESGQEALDDAEGPIPILTKDPTIQAGIASGSISVLPAITEDILAACAPAIVADPKDAPGSWQIVAKRLRFLLR